MRRTPSTWNGSPECEAQASASSSGGRSSPARTMPSAWIGLLQERGSTGASTSPTDQATLPSAVERDHGAVVVALHEPGADDLGDDDGAGMRAAGLVRSADGRMTGCLPPPVPQHCPTPRSSTTSSCWSAVRSPRRPAFNEPGTPVTLTLPEPVAAQARRGAVELVDPEGLPLARVTVRPAACVDPLTHAQYGPFRRLYLTPRRGPRAVRRPRRSCRSPTR